MLPNTARQRFSLPAAGHELAAVRGEAGRSSGVCRALCFVSVLSVPRRFLRGSRTPLPNTSKPQPGPARIKLAAGGFADERWRPWPCPVSAAPGTSRAHGCGGRRRARGPRGSLPLDTPGLSRGAAAPSPDGGEKRRGRGGHESREERRRHLGEIGTRIPTGAETASPGA